ncbi:MAG TPA: outer membrane beta-barrel protein, partial [Candidatus Kapabacteria bacterium]|nr:outer membrane beta-barrel protein [Candidatus Kapabacteria bacterium]
MIFSRVGYSQSANPLAPPLPSPRVGVEAGLNINQQSGTFQSDCGCEFSSGTGNGIVISGIGEMFLSPKVELMGKISYRFKTMDANNATDTNETVFDPVSHTIIEQPAGLNQQAKATVTYIAVTPMIRYNMFKGLFIAAGPSIGLAMSSDLLVQESFTQSGYSFQGGATTESTQPEASIQNLDAFYFALNAELGYAIPLSETLFFVPSVSIDFPLTSVQSGTNWKIM